MKWTKRNGLPNTQQTAICGNAGAGLSFLFQHTVPESDVHPASKFETDFGKMGFFDQSKTFMKAHTPFIRQRNARDDRVDLVIFLEPSKEFLVKPVPHVTFHVIRMHIDRELRRPVPGRLRPPGHCR